MIKPHALRAMIYLGAVVSQILILVQHTFYDWMEPHLERHYKDFE